jgi:hypothetical protein
LALYLGVDAHDDQICERLVDTLARYYKDFSYIHATPSHGIIFGHWAMQRFRPKNLQAYQDYQKWSLSLSRMADGSMQYVTPKRARPVIPGGGGGWLGDTAIGEKELALVHSIVLTGGDQPNLMLLGQKRLCWYGQANLDAYRRTIATFRKQRLHDGLEMARMLFSSNKKAKATKLLADLHAKRSTRDSEAAKRLSAIRRTDQWPSIKAGIEEQEAMAFYRFAALDDQFHTSNNTFKVRKPYLEYVVENYPNTSAAELARAYLSVQGPPAEVGPSNPSK